MSWRDRLVKASFKGADFFVLSSEKSVGLNTILHNIVPEDLKENETVEAKSVSIPEDFGRIRDEFVIEGYIIANNGNNQDYFSDRNTLISALSSRGAGQLLHPFYGDLKVMLLGQARISESFSEGGIARFTMTFVEWSRKATPKKTADVNTDIDGIAARTGNKMADTLSDKYVTTGNFLQVVADALQTALQLYTGAIYKVKGALSNLVSAAVGNMASLINALSVSVTTPCAVASTVLDAVEQFENLMGFGEEAISGGVVGGCSGLRRGEFETLDGETVSEELGTSAIDGMLGLLDYDEDDISFIPDEQVDNIELVMDSHKIALMTSISKITMRINFTSQEKATTYKESISDAFDDLLLRLGAYEDLDNNEMYEGVEELRNSFMENIDQKIFSIDKTLDFTVGVGNLSALQLAYNRYEDLDREQDIFDRNKPIVRHPGFLPNGETIKILDE